MEVIAMLVYLEAARLTLNDHRYRQVSGSDTFTASSRPPRRRQASAFSRAIAALRAYAERRRLANELYARNDRLLADAGFTREDILAVVDGSYVRQHEPAPIKHHSARTVRVTDATSGPVANDDEAQIAA
jgi:uncharacterized protein YjiS (DUF1127 family)